MNFSFKSIISAVFFFSFSSHADSGCWTEQRFIGKTAAGFISGINYKLFKTDIDKKITCKIEVYNEPVEKDGQTMACEKIQCWHGECGSGAEHALLPIEGFKDDLAQVRLKDEKTKWIKIDKKWAMTPILPVGKVGEMFPRENQVLDAVNGKPVSKSITDKSVYTFKKMIVIGKEEWAAVDINPVISDEPPVRVGKSKGQGYFQFRDKNGKIVSVLSDLWCD